MDDGLVVLVARLVARLDVGVRALEARVETFVETEIGLPVMDVGGVMPGVVEIELGIVLWIADVVDWLERERAEGGRLLSDDGRIVVEMLVEMLVGVDMGGELPSLLERPGPVDVLVASTLGYDGYGLCG